MLVLWPYLVGAIPTPLKKYEIVSWYYDIPNMMGKSIHPFHGSSHHQPVYISLSPLLTTVTINHHEPP